MRVAPAMRAPCTIDNPMPPAPITSTVAPASTLAVLSAAPTPVCTAHPMMHARSSGRSASILIAADSATTTYSAIAASPSPRYTTLPCRLRRVLPSGSIDIAIAAEFTQLLCSLRTHQ